VLTLTENAATFIKALAAEIDADGGAGLQIASDHQAAGKFTVAMASSPAADETVVHAAGARVFLDPAGVVALADKRLDARLQDQSVRFFLQRR
jgi:iron-sulfur cluster assembly protein